MEFANHVAVRFPEAGSDPALQGSELLDLILQRESRLPIFSLLHNVSCWAFSEDNTEFGDKDDRT